MLFVGWMIHPDYNGALLLEQRLIKYLELVYALAHPVLGK
jgi:hypothetical protein